MRDKQSFKLFSGGDSEMAYCIHLERAKGAAVTLQEWKGVVAKHPLLRLSQEAERSVVNPESGERISRTSTDGDAEIWVEEAQTWVRALRWSDGRASVNASRDFDEPSSFLRKLLRQLAEDLSAGIYGDEGEEYQ